MQKKKENTTVKEERGYKSNIYFTIGWPQNSVETYLLISALLPFINLIDWELTC